MQFSSLFIATILSAIIGVSAAPTGDVQVLADTTFGPVPGESSLFSTYYGKERPFPANYTGAIINTTHGEPGPDDRLFQNLLSAEWIIFEFYQQGVELFNQSVFEDAGWPNTTYQRLMQIRDNEAGHLRIFQNQISSNSVKPGGCQYAFPYKDALSYLAIVTALEVSSMSFLTGLVRQAQLDASKSALLAIAETETRHQTWSLISVWNEDPFSGPVDTVYPYANQIIQGTNAFIIPDSCPAGNPAEYPSPLQPLALLGAAKGTKSIDPGAEVVFSFTDPLGVLNFREGKDYWAVYFHGLSNISVPFDPSTNVSTIPVEFEQNGVIIVLIANEKGAPTPESVMAGPAVVIEQPDAVGLALATQG